MHNHHAVLLLSNSLANSGYALDIDTTEIQNLRFETLTIGDVRDIIKSAFATPHSAPTKTIVIETGMIAREAQQALLKVLEEPPVSTKFVIVIPTLEGLLPTLISRVSQPFGLLQTARSNNPLFTIFQSSSYAARMECIARITKDKDTEQIEFLRSGVLWQLSQTPPPLHAAQLTYCVTKMSERGASKKMLLEEIALLLPRS